MPGAIFDIGLRPTAGQGLVWSEGLGGRLVPQAVAQPASALSGLTLNRVPFGNSLGGLQDSGNLTFDGATLTLTGALTASGAVTFTAGTASSSTSTGTLVITGGLGLSGALFTGGNLNVGSTSATVGTTSTSGTTVVVDGIVSNRGFAFRTAGTNRWLMQINSTAEGGSDAGSNFQLLARADGGGAIDTPFSITRAIGGPITITRHLIAPAATTSIPSLRLPHGTAPSAPTDGDMWTTTAGLYVRINGATVGPLS